MDAELRKGAVMTDYVSAIESTLEQFGIDASVTGQTHGPAVTRYELTLGSGVKVEAIGRLAANFAYATAARSVRILAPIPGKTAVGIELPNEHRETVELADVLMDAGEHPLTVALGKTVDGEMLSLNLAEMPHLLVAGSTGAGKSTFINAALVSLLHRTTPDQVRMVMVDPKMVELSGYEGIGHLMRPVITEVDEAVAALNELVAFMETRYQTMKAARVRHIGQLEGHPYIVIVVDELADLIMQAGKAVEEPLVRIAQKGRAAGIHLLLATQRPSADILTGLIRANVPSRLAFATSSAIDSRIVLDEGGAEQLLGMGDALYKPIGNRTAVRVQAAYVSDKEIEAAVQDATPKRVQKEPQTQHFVYSAPQQKYVDDLITYADAAIKRVDDYLHMLNHKRMSDTDRMLAYFDSPLEVGRAGTALDEIVKGLRQIRQFG